MKTKLVAFLLAAGAMLANAEQVRLRERGMYQSAASSAARRLLAAAGSGFDAEAAAKSAVVALGDRLGVRAELGDLRVRRADSDAAGRRHVRLQQLFGGVEVDGRELIVHFDAKGGVYEINGDWLDMSAHAPFPSPAAAVAGATLVVYCQEDDAASAMLAWRLRKGRKIVFTDAQTGETLHVRRAAPGSVEDDIDDDNDGLDLDEDRIIQFASDNPFPDGVATTTNGCIPEVQGGKEVVIPAVRGADGTIYFAGMASNGVEVGILDGIAAPQFREEVKAISAQTTKTDWTDEFLSRTGWTKYSDDPNDGMPDAFSIMHNVLAIVEYYQAAFGRNSYDGKGGRVAAWRFWQMNPADLDKGFINAFWTSLGENGANTNGCFFFGYCLDNSLSETSLDICAHELTHGITSWSADLQYEGESGALNESFSDIISAACEFAVHPLAADPLHPGPCEADWLFNEDSGMVARSFAAPMDYEQPSRYKGHGWVDTGTPTMQNDNGGVHTNSGVQNHFFYLLCEGGSGVNDGIAYEVAGIGVEKAAQIAYQALTAYCGPHTDYEAVVGCWESAAWDLVDSGVLESNDVASVAQAWAAVKTPRRTVDGAAWTVTLSTHGGTLVGVEAKSPVARGRAVGALPVPEREGYAFRGWFTKKSGGTKITAKTKIAKNVTFHAQWKAKKYRVSAAVSAKAAGTVSGAGLKAYGSKVTLKAKAKKGYVFVRWEDLDDPGTPCPSALKCRQPNLTFTKGVGTISVRAVFAKASADAAPVLTVASSSDWYVESEPDREIYVAAESLSYPTVTLSGAPAGIGLVRVPDTDCEYVLRVMDSSKMKPGVYTAKITAKNRAGKSASKSVRIIAPNSSAAIADGLIAGLKTSTLAPYVAVGGMKTSTALADLGVEVFATNGWKLASVTGLPTGLSWNGKAIVGAASALGVYTATFTMKKTVGSGKKAKTYISTASATFKVEALLPEALAGTYNGFANTSVLAPDEGDESEYDEGDGDDEETYGPYTPILDGWASAAKVTVATSGKITANIGGVALSGAGFDSVSNGVYSVTLKKTQKVTKGYLKGGVNVWVANLEIDTNAGWDALQLVGSYYTYNTKMPSMTAPAWIVAQRNPFALDDAKTVAAAVAASGRNGAWGFVVSKAHGESHAYTLDCAECIVGGKAAVTVTAKANGTVALAGKIGSTKVSGTATLELSGAGTATARFFTSKFVVEVAYSLEDGEVVSASGKVWKK